MTTITTTATNTTTIITIIAIITICLLLSGVISFSGQGVHKYQILWSGEG